jgi:hypothetical protein
VAYRRFPLPFSDGIYFTTLSPLTPTKILQEVLYYLDEAAAQKLLSDLSDRWLKQGGLFILGMDHFEENEECHGWAALNSTPMLLRSEGEWKAMLEDAGFEILKQWRAGKRVNSEASYSGAAGTMAVLARNRRLGVL